MKSKVMRFFLVKNSFLSSKKIFHTDSDFENVNVTLTVNKNERVIVTKNVIVNVNVNVNENKKVIVTENVNLNVSANEMENVNEKETFTNSIRAYYK